MRTPPRHEDQHPTASARLFGAPIDSGHSGDSDCGGHTEPAGDCYAPRMRVGKRVGVVLPIAAVVLLSSGCAKSASESPAAAACGSAQEQVSTFVTTPTGPTAVAINPEPVATGTSFDSVIAAAEARSLAYGANQDAIAAKAQALLLAAYVVVQHPTCFSDADLAAAQLVIDRAKQPAP